MAVDNLITRSRSQRMSRRTLVLTASSKRCAAVMLGGKRADAACWFDAPSGKFTTSEILAARDSSDPLLRAVATGFHPTRSVPVAQRHCVEAS